MGLIVGPNNQFIKIFGPRLFASLMLMNLHLDLISWTKYVCPLVVSQGKACCTLKLLCRFMYHQGLSNSGILLGFIEKLIFLLMPSISIQLKARTYEFRSLVGSSISGCLRILIPANTGSAGNKVSSFSIKVLSNI